jgi:hypothetical protein
MQESVINPVFLTGKCDDFHDSQLSGPKIKDYLKAVDGDGP